MDKLTVNVGNVRCHGNVVSETSVDSFSTFKCTLTRSSVEIGGLITPCYIMNYNIDEIVLTSDKNILSYSDGESATLTAELMYQDSPVSILGVSVDFNVYDENDILLETLTSVTDSNGQCSVSYHSNNAGNISIKAICHGITSNSVLIEDILKNYKLDGTESITTIATYTPTIVDNTLTNGCGYLSDGFDNTNDWELSFDYMYTSVASGALILPAGVTQRDKSFIQIWVSNVYFRNPTSLITNFNNIAPNQNTWYNIMISKIGTTITIYVDDVQKGQVTISTINDYNELFIGLDKSVASSSSTIKNIKIKSL